MKFTAPKDYLPVYKCYLSVKYRLYYIVHIKLLVYDETDKALAGEFRLVYFNFRWAQFLVWK